MARRYCIALIFNLLLIFLATESGIGQSTGLRSVQFMFYNVENLFDIIDDTIKNDDDFLPAGLMRWNGSRYKKKVNSLYKTIIAAGDWNPPEIVAMCEVENRNVLEDIVYGTPLSKYKYRIIHEESPDQRGIDVCLIYRSDLIKVLEYDYWIPINSGAEDFTSRSVLYSKVLIVKDTLHLIINHWPSRRGGVLAGEDLRIKIAAMVREKSDSIIASDGADARIIIAGDFNSTPGDQEMKQLVANFRSENILVNLSDSLAGKGKGTYRYQGRWEMIDQVIVSEGLLLCTSGFCSGRILFSVFAPDFLLIKDPKYPGPAPFSTYRGYRYQGGFSDHLPVILKLIHRDHHQQE